MLLGNLALSLTVLGRLTEALDYAERALARGRATGAETAVTLALFHLTSIHLRLGDLDAAARDIAALEPRVEIRPEGHYYHYSLLSLRAMLAQERGEYDFAREAHDRVIAMADEQDLPLLLLRRAAFELETGRFEASRADAARALALTQKSVEPGVASSRVGLAHLAVARALSGLGRAEESRAAAEAALAQLEPSMGADHPESRAARELAVAAPSSNAVGDSAGAPPAAPATPSSP
jgi:tetratricopeptide (TPR) repeat protein